MTGEGICDLHTDTTRGPLLLSLSPPITPMDGHLLRRGGGITHTLAEAMERLRKNHYHLRKALCEARENPTTRLEEWRRAPWGSQEWRKAAFCEQALRVLGVSASH